MNNEDKRMIEEDLTNGSAINRRNVLKALTGIPVIGFFAYQLFKSRSFHKQKENAILDELGIGGDEPVAKEHAAQQGALIRIGMIGFGNRAQDLAKALGYLHPSRVAEMKKGNALNEYLQQEDLNVALVGICDVFDLHAENGLATAQSEIHSGGQGNLPIKRYSTYRELLDDKNIDAVIVATPDHHHAAISREAIKSGKHVYCEKSVAQSEEELNELYKTVTTSKCVYQLGHQVPQNVIFKQARELINKNVLGKITLIETTTNRNSADGAWIRHLDKDGNPKPGDESMIDWQQWLGSAKKVPFSIDRFYNWTKWFDYDMGMIGQLFTHEYDAVNQLLRIGIPNSVVASGGIYYWKDNRDIPDVLHAVFEYPERDLTLTYSANLASGLDRGRVFMGNDASMELGASVKITADQESKRYKKKIEDGTIDTSVPMISIQSGSTKVDAVTSATARYYAKRGLDSTTIGGREVDITHLHIKEWLDCIRYGGVPSANIERAFEEGITCLMAHKSYVEKRRVEWDPIGKRIV